MKKNDWILITATLLYSLLFYDQYAGLNFFLFNIGLLALLIWKNPSLLWKRDFQWASLAALISSFFIFKYSSDLAITANFFSLAFLSATCLDPKLSVITGMVHSLVSTAGSTVFMILDILERSRKKAVSTVSRPFHVYLLLAFVVFIVCLIFFFLYRGANPLFSDFTKKINFDFISGGWIAFTIAGFMLMYGFFYNRRIPFLAWFDDHIPSDLDENTAATRTMKLGWLQTNTELLTGIILLLLLNMLLLVVNSLDLHYLWFDGTLPKGIKHKEFVHDGVNMLIASIVFAVLILLFFFRGLLNFHQKNKFLKLLAYVWIFQNLFMIFSTAWRNDMYISESGLSYKKIGVFVYLLLAAVGLITTYYKLNKVKSNWYLFRTNAAVCFILLIAGCTINWDVIITSFNIEKAKDPTKKLEKYYLADLSFKNIPYLLTLDDTVVMNDDTKARDYYFSSRGTWFENFGTAIHNKLFSFMLDMEHPSWPSRCLEKERVLAEIQELSDKGKLDSLDLRYYSDGVYSLSPVRSFSNLRVLRLKNASIGNAGQFSWFPHLLRLDLISTQVDSLEKFPSLKELKDLEMPCDYEERSENYGDRLYDLSFLQRLTSLEKLNVRKNDLTRFSAIVLPASLQNLDISNCGLKDLNAFKFPENIRVIYMKGNSINDYSALYALKHLEVIYIDLMSQEQLTEFKKHQPTTIIK